MRCAAKTNNHKPIKVELIINLKIYQQVAPVEVPAA